MYEPFATLFIEFYKRPAWVFTPLNWWKVQSTVQSSDVFGVFFFPWLAENLPLSVHSTFFLDILEGTEFFIVYQLFDDVVEALLQLIESSETSEAVSRWFVLSSEFVMQNWPPYRVLKTDVSSVSPSLEPSCKYFVSANRLTRFIRRAPENKCCFRVDLSVAVLLVWDIRPFNYHMTRSALRVQSYTKLQLSRCV